MSKEDINAIVDNALEDNPAGMRDAFYDAINDKIFAAIEQRKIAVAANMVNAHHQQAADNAEVANA
jgi:hypothetical protein